MEMKVELGLIELLYVLQLGHLIIREFVRNPV